MNRIRKYLNIQAKAVGERTIRFIATDASVDRDREVITSEGWDFKNFKKNPSFLWAHNYSQPPVGKVTRIKFEKGTGHLMDVEFADRETYAFADTIFKLYKGGFLNAVSVGFIVKERVVPEDRNTPIKLTKKELLELSAVPVPANPNAIQQNSIKSAVEDGCINEQEYQEFMLSAKQFINKNMKCDDCNGEEEKTEEKEDNIIQIINCEKHKECPFFKAVEVEVPPEVPEEEKSIPNGIYSEFIKSGISKPNEEQLDTNLVNEIKNLNIPKEDENV